MYIIVKTFCDLFGGLYGPAAGALNVEMFGNNHFFAFFNALDHADKESSGCKSDPLLGFLKFKMASKMVDE